MKKTTYKNKGGLHILADGTPVKPGETFTCVDPDICAKFPNKFELVGSDTTPVNATTEAAPGAGTKKAPKGDNGQAGAAGGNEPQDVTSEFDLSADTDGVLTVRKEGGKWAIYEEGDDEPLNEKPLTKSKVQAFITDYLTEED